MATPLGRYTQFLFGSGASAGQMAQFGSFAAGTPVTYSGSTISPAEVQALSQYLAGWYSAVVGNGSFAKQDINSLEYLWSHQLAYLFQQGIPAYDSGTTYFPYSVVQSSGGFYVALNNGSTSGGFTSQTPPNITYWAPLYTDFRNYLVNGGFEICQRSPGGGALTCSPNTSGFYGNDRWYVNYQCGPSSPNLNITPLSVGINGYTAMQLSIGSGSGGTTSGNFMEVCQVLENSESLALYNQTASFSVQVLALNHVNQIGVQFIYNTSEAKPALNATGIGTEQFFAVNTSTPTTCFISGQALGTSMTTSGVIGIRIRATGVSSGYLSDTLNGFLIQEAMLNIGPTPVPYSRQNLSLAVEYTACQRWYETLTSGVLGQCISTSSVVFASQLSVLKRVTPTPSNPFGGLNFVMIGIGLASVPGTVSWDNVTTSGFNATFSGGSGYTSNAVCVVQSGLIAMDASI